MNTITMSAIVVTLFFGGPNGPAPHVVHWLWPILWFLVKTIIFLYVYVWIRASLPRLRYDQLMDLGWKFLIPLSLFWLLVVAGGLISWPWTLGVFGGSAVFALMLWQAVRVSRARRDGLAEPALEPGGSGPGGGLVP
jgi:NADH-quinone oxidoreductase subunit H